MKGKRWVLTAALIIAAVRMWEEVRGTTKTPFVEWAVGWGALFFILAILSELAEDAAAWLAGVVVVGDLLTNGQALFTDVSGAVTQSEKGSPIFPGLSPSAAATAAPASTPTPAK